MTRRSPCGPRRQRPERLGEDAVPAGRCAFDAGQGRWRSGRGAGALGRRPIAPRSKCRPATATRTPGRRRNGGSAMCFSCWATGRSDGEDFSQAVAALEAALAALSTRPTCRRIGRSCRAISAAPITTLPARAATRRSTRRRRRRIEAALAVYAALPDRTLWAAVEGDLGNALMMQASASADAETPWRSRSQAYEAALTVTTRDKDADDWARNQTNLANALSTLGYWRNDVALLKRSAGIYRTMQTVRTRERAPEHGRATQDEPRARARLIAARKPPDPKCSTRRSPSTGRWPTQVGRDRDPDRWASAAERDRLCADAGRPRRKQRRPLRGGGADPARGDRRAEEDQGGAGRRLHRRTACATC